MYPTNAVEDFFIVCAHSVIDGFRYPKPNIFGTQINNGANQGIKVMLHVVNKFGCRIM